jgi:hypothetical protein
MRAYGCRRAAQRTGEAIVLHGLEPAIVRFPPIAADQSPSPQRLLPRRSYNRVYGRLGREAAEANAASWSTGAQPSPHLTRDDAGGGLRLSDPLTIIR